jgi:hypothetical protein
MVKLLLRKRDEFSLWRPRFNPRIVNAIYLAEHGFVGAVRVSPVNYHSVIAESHLSSIGPLKAAVESQSPPRIKIELNT